MNNVGYIGYKHQPNTIGLPPGGVTLATGGAALPITAIIDVAIAALPFLIPWISNAFQSPAKDSRNIINDLKPQLINKDARERLGLVIAAGQKINVKAKDVEARELLLWYRQAYPNDYQILLPDDKIYFNNYILSIRNTRGDGNNMYANLDKAMFTQSEINYNANPIQSITNIISNKNNLLLYGGIALALILLIKK
jgi:hypothetical protein